MDGAYGEDVRAGAEASLGPISTEEWNFAVESGWVTEAVEYTDAVTYLCERINRARAAFGRSTPSGDEVPVELPDGVRRRDRTLAHVVAAEMTEQSEVRAFRRTLLEGRLLDPKAVHHWLSRRGGRTHAPGLVTLAYQADDSDRTRSVHVPAVSVLGELAAWTRYQADQLGWQPADGTMFVLTGDVPPIPSVRAKVSVQRALRSWARVTLEVEPTLTPDQLAEVYRQVRVASLPGSRPRAMDQKNLDLVFFVADDDQRRQPGEARPTWAERKAVWDRTYQESPGYPYADTALEQFARDARRAKTSLLNPPYLGEAHG